MVIPVVRLKYSAVQQAAQPTFARFKNQARIPRQSLRFPGRPRDGNLYLRIVVSTPSRWRRFPALSALIGSGSRRHMRGKPRGPVPPASASAVQDSPEMPDSRPPSAKAAPIRGFARLRCMYDGRPPGRPPALRGLRGAPAQVSGASPAAPTCAEAVLKSQHKGPCRSRTGETQSPPHQSRCTGRSRSADFPSPPGTPIVLPVGAPGRLPFSPIVLQVAWPHLPLFPPGHWTRGVCSCPTCRPVPGERAGYCGSAMNQAPRSNLHCQQIAPNARSSEKRNLAMRWLNPNLACPSILKNGNLTPPTPMGAIQFPRVHKLPVLDERQGAPVLEEHTARVRGSAQAGQRPSHAAPAYDWRA